MEKTMKHEFMILLIMMSMAVEVPIVMSVPSYVVPLQPVYDSGVCTICHISSGIADETLFEGRSNSGTSQNRTQCHNRLHCAITKANGTAVPGPTNTSVPGSTRPIPGKTPPVGTKTFVDDFVTLDTNVWRCEFSCANVKNGFANFILKPGYSPNDPNTWSKLVYKNQLNNGRYTMRFSVKPNSRSVWWGLALWKEYPDGTYDEINFGAYDRDNNMIDLESTKAGIGRSVSVDTGIDLYDGNFHTVSLDVRPNKVSMIFDGAEIASITDTNVIPTSQMDFLVGSRLVDNTPLTTESDMIIDYVTISP